RAAGRDPVQQPADRSGDQVLEAGDLARPERRGGESAQPAVVRRIHLQEGQLWRLVLGEPAADAEPAVPQDLVAERMVRSDPGANRGTDQPAGRTDPVVERVRVDPALVEVQPGQRVAAQPAVQDEVETFPDELPDEGRLSRHGRRPFPLLLTVYSSPVSVTLPTLEDLHALKPLQQPSYPDPAQVADVVARLRALPPLVFAGECDEL